MGDAAGRPQPPRILRPPRESYGAEVLMDWFAPILIFVAWLVLTGWVLPRLGVPT
jgi:hypothetical protein